MMIMMMMMMMSDAVCMCECARASISAAVCTVSANQPRNPSGRRDYRRLFALRSTQEGSHLRLRNTLRHRRQVSVSFFQL